MTLTYSDTHDDDETQASVAALIAISGDKRQVVAYLIALGHCPLIHDRENGFLDMCRKVVEALRH